MTLMMPLKGFLTNGLQYISWKKNVYTNSILRLYIWLPEWKHYHEKCFSHFSIYCTYQTNNFILRLANLPGKDTKEWTRLTQLEKDFFLFKDFGFTHRKIGISAFIVTTHLHVFLFMLDSVSGLLTPKMLTILSYSPKSCKTEKVFQTLPHKDHKSQQIRKHDMINDIVICSYNWRLAGLKSPVSLPLFYFYTFLK